MKAGRRPEGGVEGEEVISGLLGNRQYPISNVQCPMSKGTDLHKALLDD
jgi:hypothetical protein